MQAIGNNVDSGLHDEIPPTFNSVFIYLEVAKQQAEKEIPSFDSIGSNSGQIIREHKTF